MIWFGKCTEKWFTLEIEENKVSCFSTVHFGLYIYNGVESPESSFRPNNDSGQCYRELDAWMTRR